MPRFWLAFDISLRADYEKLYQWLDSVGAEECGQSAATFVVDMSITELMFHLRELVGRSVRDIRLYPGVWGVPHTPRGESVLFLANRANPLRSLRF